jgi:molecular chaperone HscB
MNLQSNDFELFGLTPQFAQDRAAVDARWKDLQREAHPDKFAAQGAAAQRVAMQWSVRINEAYQRLKDPLKRAAYLCELNAAPVNAENNTAMPSSFLMQQMEWREALDEASSAADLDALGTQVTAARREVLHQCGQLLDVQQDYKGAVQQVRALMFIEKFANDVEARLDRMDTEERGQ